MSLTHRNIQWLQRRACANRSVPDTVCVASFPQPLAQEILKIYGRLGAVVASRVMASRVMASSVLGGRRGLQAPSGAGE